MPVGTSPFESKQLESQQKCGVHCGNSKTSTTPSPRLCAISSKLHCPAGAGQSVVEPWPHHAADAGFVGNVTHAHSGALGSAVQYLAPAWSKNDEPAESVPASAFSTSTALLHTEQLEFGLIKSATVLPLYSVPRPHTASMAVPQASDVKSSVHAYGGDGYSVGSIVVQFTFNSQELYSLTNFESL